MGQLIPVLVASLAVVLFLFGVFDRPDFEYHDSFPELVTIVAVSRKKNIGEHVMALMQAAESAILASPDGARMMEAAANLYGGGAEGKLGVGLYFDDPKTEDNPRWAVGWAVGTDVNQARLIAAQGAAATGQADSIRVVRVPNSRVLKASIPWRSRWTPMIAPMLHWERGMAKYMKDNSKEAMLALEVYVSGENDKYKTIDYIVYPDDSIPLNDAFGPSATAEGGASQPPDSDAASDAGLEGDQVEAIHTPESEKTFEDKHESTDEVQLDAGGSASAEAAAVPLEPEQERRPETEAEVASEVTAPEDAHANEDVSAEADRFGDETAEDTQNEVEEVEEEQQEVAEDDYDVADEHHEEAAAQVEEMVEGEDDEELLADIDVDEAVDDQSEEEGVAAD